MDTDLIILSICIFTAIMTSYNSLRIRNQQNYSLLNYRISKLEHTISCLQSYVRLNSPSFSDKMDELIREFEKKLNEKKYE